MSQIVVAQTREVGFSKTDLQSLRNQLNRELSGTLSFEKKTTENALN